MVEAYINPERDVKIAVVGKYIELNDAYKSIYEALNHGGIPTKTRVKIEKISTDRVDVDDPGKVLSGMDGVLVPGGYGERGVEAKIAAARWAGANKVPYFGICLGMQCATIYAARELLGLPRAYSREFNEQCEAPVIDRIEEQKKISDKGGTQRLGSYPCRLTPGSIAQRAYGTDLVQERHRHRYEYNNHYREDLVKQGLKVTGVYEKLDLVEIVELEGHPWFVGVQYHPEFKSKPTEPHPLFRSFIEAAARFHARLDLPFASDGSNGHGQA
jgi:CTP synthase